MMRDILFEFRQPFFESASQLDPAPSIRANRIQWFSFLSCPS
jgi:hypothetical protein